MKKFLTNWSAQCVFHRVFLIMRISFILLLVSSTLAFSTDTYSQNLKLSLNLRKATVKEIITAIEDQSEFIFFYEDKEVDLNRKVDIKVKNQDINNVLDHLFENSSNNYLIKGRQIIIGKKKPVEKVSTQEVIIESSQPEEIGITGKVVDENGEGLPGVNIILKGTSMGTVTEINGQYSIEVVDENSVLVFSSVGYMNQEVTVGDQTIINISMTEDMTSLDEVVVVGYGTQKKETIIGSMVSVDGDEIVKLKTTNFAENLQGLASGVLVSNSSGHPGNAPKIIIRGINSLSLSSDPLWIIDGVPIFTGAAENLRDGVKGVSALSMINPNDIESIEILKDAAATAIYGSRASGGVILVTTKSAEKGLTGMSISYDGGVGKIPFSQNDIYVDSKTYWRLSDKSAENANLVPETPNSIIGTKIMGDQPLMTKEEALATNTDHLGALSQNSLFHQFGLTANKGFGTGGVMFSMNYRDEKGLIRNNDFQRFTGRFNFNFKPVNSVEIGITTNFIYLKANGVRAVGGKAQGGWWNWATVLPWMKIYDENSDTGYWAAQGGYNMRAFSDRKLTRYDVDEYRSLSNAYVQWTTPLEGLKVRGEVGVDLLVNNSSFWRSSLLAPFAPHYSLAEEQSFTQSIINYSVYANYNKTFNEIHDVDFTIGTEANTDWSYTRKFAGSGLQTIYPELRNPLIMQNMIGYQSGDNSLMGFFGRINYKLADRYLLHVSARRDGHSAFSDENRWANFYAIGAGWILTNENFMKDMSFLTFLKLRGSYGTTGNTKVTNEMTYMQWGLNTRNIWGVNGPAGGTTIGPLGSSGLKWETTTNLDIGLDFGILDNRINGSLAYYNQNIEDLILLAGVQPSVGFNSNYIYENAGDMNNWGFEFNISSSNIVKGDFKWNTDFNISTNKNKILTLNESESGKGKIASTTIRKEGEAFGTYFLANYAGIDPDKGIPLIEERDDEIWDSEFETVSTGNLIPSSNANVINNRMIQHGKTALPTYYGGLNNVFYYKNFDLTILLVFSGGNWLRNDLYSTGWAVGIDNNIIKERGDNNWEKPGDVAEWPLLLPGNDMYYDDNGDPSPGTKYIINYPQTTRFYEKADYIRVRNLQLGYTFSGPGFNSLRLYVGGTNLWTITGYKGLDPETLSDLPMPRVFNFGLSLSF